MRKKILLLTTYPIDKPDHGGKLRSFNIKKSLESRFDVDILSFEQGLNNSIRGMKVCLEEADCMQVIGHGYLADWGINTYLNVRPKFRDEIFEAVRAYAPDVLFMEQPFLWPLVREMIQQGVVGKDVFLVYSSQNNESELKKRIYDDLFDKHEAEHKLAIVRDIEEGAIRNAHLSMAVTEDDVCYLRSIAPETDVLLYRNGHNGFGSAGLIQKWKRKFSDAERNWVFVGSWHPPNIDGLDALARSQIAGVPPGKLKIWVFGNVGPGLLHVRQWQKESLPNFEIMGLSDAEDINSAILASSGVVLPVWSGGGSNLKTAQALLSGKPIVGSRYSFRGFEEFANEGGVFLFDEAREIFEALLNQPLEDSYRRDRADESLRWDRLLEGMPDKIQFYLDKLR